VNHARPLLAEFLGTFLLVFFGPGAAVVQAQTGALGHWGVAIVFGLTVAAVATVFGPISGAHINPVVTLALALSKRFAWSALPGYWLAQLLGASAASWVLLLTFGSQGQLGVTLPRGSVEQAFVIEAVLTFWLILVALRAQGNLAGLLVGSVVMLEAMMGGPITGASMNPARSFGPALLSGIWQHHWLYWLAPLLGAILAVIVQRMLQPEDKTIEMAV
jgi:MIP family channel proteins